MDEVFLRLAAHARLNAKLAVIEEWVQTAAKTKGKSPEKINALMVLELLPAFVRDCSQMAASADLLLRAMRIGELTGQMAITAIATCGMKVKKPQKKAARLGAKARWAGLREENALKYEKTLSEAEALKLANPHVSTTEARRRACERTGAKYSTLLKHLSKKNRKKQSKSRRD